jgi:predicted Ser/Thr protein kinase
MQLADNSAGKQFRCPSCQNPFTVGGGQPAPVGAAAVGGGGAAVAATGRAGAPPPPPARPPSTPAVDLPAGKAAAAPTTPTECPACKAALLPGAIACMDCGYLIQPETTAAEMEGAPNLCPNPACGVANPPGERNCQRCGTVLPTAPGTVLHGRYKIDRLLAMGGFGAVYLASDTKGGNRPVAIKDMICADPQEFAIRLNFFRREAEILRSLETIPIVPRVFDLIEQGQSAHLVLEFIRGQDLLKLMEANNNKPFTLDQVIEWAKSICDVLTHMHTQSPPLVHRDLKPDNIMLLEDHRSIKMIDFGTARDLGRTVKEKMAAKTRVYTEGYAPPEQIVGKPEPRSDLFALAGTMYHLVTGKAPEGFYTARELEGAVERPQQPDPGQPALVLRAYQAEPGGGCQRSLLLGAGDQGRPGAAPGHQGAGVPEVSADQQGPRAVLLQVRRAYDRRDAAVLSLRQDQPHGQPLLHPLRQSTPMRSPRFRPTGCGLRIRN